MTINQFADEAGLSRASVQNLMSKIDFSTNKSVLDRSTPFSFTDKDKDEIRGPIFVPMNDKAKAYLKGRKERLKGKQG